MNKDRLEIYGNIYAWLVAALYCPEEELLHREFYEEAEDLSLLLNLDFSHELKLAAEYLSLARGGLQELKVEHCRLFIGSSPLLCPPYESCYRENGIVMGDCTIAVQRIYHQWGFEVESSFKEPPDHIVLELSFLSEMCHRGHFLRERGDEIRAQKVQRAMKDFLSDHLLSWIYVFTASIEKSAGSPFYPAIAHLLTKTARAHFFELSGAEETAEKGS